jgi:hypothetical protein
MAKSAYAAHMVERDQVAEDLWQCLARGTPFDLRAVQKAERTIFTSLEKLEAVNTEAKRTFLMFQARQALFSGGQDPVFAKTDAMVWPEDQLRFLAVWATAVNESDTVALRKLLKERVGVVLEELETQLSSVRSSGIRSYKDWYETLPNSALWPGEAERRTAAMAPPKSKASKNPVRAPSAETVAHKAEESSEAEEESEEDPPAQKSTKAPKGKDKEKQKKKVRAKKKQHEETESSSSSSDSSTTDESSEEDDGEDAEEGRTKLEPSVVSNPKRWTECDAPQLHRDLTSWLSTLAGTNAGGKPNHPIIASILEERVANDLPVLIQIVFAVRTAKKGMRKRVLKNINELLFEFKLLAFAVRNGHQEKREARQSISGTEKGMQKPDIKLQKIQDKLSKKAKSQQGGATAADRSKGTKKGGKSE